jgi:hypothetical protein
MTSQKVLEVTIFRPSAGIAITQGWKNPLFLRTDIGFWLFYVFFVFSPWV